MPPIFFIFNAPLTTATYTLSLHDALPITFIMQVENSEIHDVIASCESAYDTGHALSKDDVSRLLGAIYNRVYDSDNMLTTLWDSEPDGLIETLDTCIRESGYFDLIYDDD